MIAEWLSEHGGKRRDACGGGGAVRGGYRNILNITSFIYSKPRYLTILENHFILY